MEIRITQQQYNPLLKRREITFEVDHSKTRTTPTRLEVRKAIAEMLKANSEVVYVKKIETKAGTMRATGCANAYDSIEQARLVEPQYIIARNVPKEKKEEAPEKAETAPPPEKAEQRAEKEEQVNG